MTRHRLRQTLTAVFVLLAVIGGTCGAVGLVYVNRINATVTLFTDLTSPMLGTIVQLVEDTLRSRVAFGSTWSRERPPVDELRTHLDTFHNNTSERLTELRRQFHAAGVTLELHRTEELERELVAAVERTIRDYHVLSRANALASEAAETTRDAFRALESRLDDIITSAEADISIMEEETKVGVQTGTVAVEDLGRAMSDFFNRTYQILEKSRWLSHEIHEIEETAAALQTAARPEEIGQLSTRLMDAFATGGNLLALLKGRLTSQSHQARFVALRDAFERMQKAMLGPGGMVESARGAASAAHALRVNAVRANELEGTYFALLKELRNAVASINRDARQSAAATIANARLAVGATVIVALLAAIVLAAWMSRRITRPLSSLTDHAVAVGETGTLEPLMNCDVLRREDEIATLALAFNRMIGELAEARSQLIAQSQEEIRIQYERLNAAITNMPQGLAMFDGEARLVVCNERFRELYDMDRSLTAPGTPYEAVVRAALENCIDSYVAEHGGDLDTMVARALAGFGANRFSVRELRHERTVAVHHRPMAGGGAVATHEDITERRRAEARIAHMAMHDMLTDLANRVAFREELSSALQRVRRGEEMAVLYFDLDHFKHVNDSLGHPVGDALLRAVAARLKACVRETDTVARLGGDEFAIVQVSLNQPRGAAELAARLVSEIGSPYEIDGQTVVIGVSIGIALAPTDGTDPDILLRNADMALYRSKADGRGTYSFFEPSMDARMQARRVLELELRRAHALDEFELFYQPLVNTRTGRVTGCEALLRWNHPERGIVPPGEFVAVAEEIGLLVDLGAWVLRKACAAAAGWPSNLKVSVNLSPSQFVHGRLLEDVKRALEQSGLAPGRLELEITEDLLVRNPDATIAALYELRALGVHVTMDDFGTGYSSLGYLRQFPFDTIKIDRSFVHDMAGRRDAVAIVRAINGLAAALGIETVAEGVETDEQLVNARNEGCSAIQGEFFSAAVPLHEVDELLHRQLGVPTLRRRRDAA